MYNDWANKFSKTFRTHLIPRISAVQNIKSCDTLSFINETTSTQALAFIVNDGEMIAKTHIVSEFFINSKFKTNKEKLGLYAVVLYMLGKRSHLRFSCLRPIVIESIWVGNINSIVFYIVWKKTILRFNQQFFFSDKSWKSCVLFKKSLI